MGHKDTNLTLGKENMTKFILATFLLCLYVTVVMSKVSLWGEIIDPEENEDSKISVLQEFKMKTDVDVPTSVTE